MTTTITVISNKGCWMEQQALDQLNAVAGLNGVTRVAGLPDLHAGVSPIGMAAESRGIFYPHLVGSDAGCGMELFSTGIRSHSFRKEQAASRLARIKDFADIPCENLWDEESPIYSLGTIGGGNHFAEFQVLEKVYDVSVTESLGLDAGTVYLLMHSGSRDFGQRLYNSFPDTAGYAAGSPEEDAYFSMHSTAVLWAQRNRFCVAKKLVEYLGYPGRVVSVTGTVHNFLERADGTFIHRKGAAPADRGPVIIPGSRGTLSYLAVPAEDTDISIKSLSHGAGRKWARCACRPRLKEKYSAATIRQTKLKSSVICHDTDLLYQEAPEAYKNIEHVVQALVERGLMRIAATFKPLITFKA